MVGLGVKKTRTTIEAHGDPTLLKKTKSISLNRSQAWPVIERRNDSIV